MSSFNLSEQKALVFHQAVLGLTRNNSELIPHTLNELNKLRDRKPEQADLWNRWSALLDAPFEKMSEIILADTPDGGLLRANSPFMDAMSKTERNLIWQHIGFLQFVRYYLEAVDDLALELPEQAAITGFSLEELAVLKTQVPADISAERLDGLKQVISLQKMLFGLNLDQKVRRNWLRHESETLKGVPLSLMVDGKAAYVLESLTGVAQLTVRPEDMPRMG
ncbi:MAG: hypothetical protein COB59_11415 [Rhodospirillaceae bacterium]|nr:MAG: hypothetical protein COB59_11415 [Rhodospirillaceae bacterium]